MELNKRQFVILVVDDDPDDQFLIANAVRETELDIKLLSCYNGSQALELLSNNILKTNTQYPDLIICDINMPIMDGIELLKNISKSARLKRIPLFIFSTSCDEDTKKTLIGLGAIDCLIKPVYSGNYKVLIADMLNRIDTFNGI